MKLGLDKQYVLLGPPGCGKTEALLRAVERHLDEGVEPESIAYVSFTRKATREAVDRACKKFDIDRKRMPYFRTIHSLCFQQLALAKDQVMGAESYREIGELLGVRFAGTHDEEDGSMMPTGGTLGDKMLFVYELARVRRVSMENAYHELCQDRSFTWHHFKQFVATVDEYRRTMDMMDFTEMLEQFVKQGRAVPVSVAIIDEAQDLSPLQWQVLRVAFATADFVYIAGDDDQAIYSWSGADVASFLALEGKHVMLSRSYRIPRAVHELAHRIITPVSQRYVKKFDAREEQGEVQWLTTPEQADFDHDDGTWLLLARNVFQLGDLERIVRDRGLSYLSRGGHTSVKRASARAILTWEKLRAGDECMGNDIKAAYDFLKVGVGVKRGFKGLKKMEDDAPFTIQQLIDEWGLLYNARVPWHDALEMHDVDRQYYLAIERRHGLKALVEVPRIHINTIHGVKGGEADHVVLMTDLARRTYEQYQQQPDDERRVFYVGATRARNRLLVVLPTTNQFFTI